MAQERRQSVENCSGALRAEVCLEVLPKKSHGFQKRIVKGVNPSRTLWQHLRFCAFVSGCLCVCVFLRVSMCLSSFACLVVACLFMCLFVRMSV